MYELLKEANVISCFVRIILAFLFGGIVGMERGKKGRPAGLRTYMLVCVGSALVMITNQYMVALYPSIDPSRMGAQVISGIGFLGAGTIIITGKNRVKGLTTAAGLWAVACVGLAIGIGFYYGAIIGAICIFVVMELLHTLDDKMMAGSKVLNVYIEFEELSRIGNFMERIKSKGAYASEMELLQPDCRKQEEKVAAIFTLQLKKKMPHSKVVEAIQQMDGVIFVEEV